MSIADSEALLEECLDELGAAIEKLERFPDAVLAHALRAHLQGLLHVLEERGEITENEIEGFVRGLADYRGPVLP
jgi:hypothetical protein